MLKLETIMNESLWVVKMIGWRKVGTYDEIKSLVDDEDCRDVDLCAKQPDHLKEFFDLYFEHCRVNGWTTVPEYYEKHYAKDAEEADYIKAEREGMAMY